MVTLLASIAFVPILIPVIIGLVKFNKAGLAERSIVYLVVLALVAELISSALWRMEMNNLFISHILTPIELFLLLSYYSRQFGSRFRFLVLGVACLFVIFAIIDMTVLHSPFKMNALAKTVECIILIVLSLIVWGKTMIALQSNTLNSTPLFWINSAVLIYFSANILLFIFSLKILNTGELAIWIWKIHFVFMTIYYLLISIGLWKIKGGKNLSN
ncbi:MAG: hypothetical protein ACJASQ_003561 [Crocinitomicaceae bacterium]|jgi:hypothetical protein